MAKRGAEFQMTKDGDGGMPDFQFGASPGEVGGIQPQRANAQQMAKRKIATGRKPRVASASSISAPQYQQQSSFTFSGNQSSPWSGSFGATATNFGQPDTSSSQTSSNPPDKPPFAPFTSSPTFGSSQQPSSSTASSTPGSSAAAANTFSFGTNSSSLPNGTTTNSIFQSSSQPTANGVSGTSQTNIFNSKPLTNGVEASKSSNPFSFPSSSTIPPKPIFGDSTPAKPVNPFQSQSTQQSTTAPSTPFSMTNGVPATQDKELSSEEILRVKEFLSQIESKFQSMERFQEETRKEVNNMSELTASKTASQVAEEFASELSKILPEINSAGAGAKITISATTALVLFAMIDKHLPTTSQPPASGFTPKPATSSMPSNPFASKPAESSTPNNPFGLQSSTKNASANPFTNSTTPANLNFNTFAATPSAATPSLDIATLRDMLRTEAQQQLSAFSTSMPTMDASKLKDMLPTLFSQSFSSIKSEDLPAGAEVSLLREAVKEGISQAFTKLQNENTGVSLTEADIREMFSSALQNCLPTINAVMVKALNSSSPSQGNVLSLEEALNQTRNLKAQCEQVQPPNTLPTPPYSLDKLTSTQRQQFTAGWRIKLFARAVEEILQKLSSDPIAISKVIQEYDSLRLEMAMAAGLKRKAPSDASAFTESPSKRPHSGTSTTAGGLFGTAIEKRVSETDEGTPAAKRTRANDYSASTPAGSQTSQLFASLSQKPTNNANATSQQTSSTNFFASASSASKSDTPLFNMTQNSPSKASESANTASKPSQFNIAPPASGNNFFAQFNKMASQTADKEKAKRKAEDYDSEEETEEEWEKRDAVEQAAKRQKLMAGSAPTGFVPKMASAEASKDGDADNEDSTEEPSADKTPRAKTNCSAATSTPSTTTGKSLFDRVQDSKKDSTPPTLAPNGDKTWKPDTPIKFGSGSAGSSPPSSRSSLFGENTATAPAPKANVGGMFGTSSQSSSMFTPKPTGANFFAPKTTNSTDSNATTATAPPTFNFTAASPQKTTQEKSTSLFNFATPNASSGPAIDGISTAPAKSLFGTSTTPASTTPITNPFAHLAENPSIFQTPPSALSTGGLTPGGSVFATAGSSRATSPGITTGDESTGSGAGDETPAKDPQLDLSESRAGEENEECIYEIRTKASEFCAPDGDEKTAKEWVTRGVGPLRLLKHGESGKVRLVMRAVPASRVVLNTGLLPSTKYEMPTAKSVKFLASNAGRISWWTLQVGKAEDAKALKAKLDENKEVE